jgi:hypothetical protein
LFKVVGVFRTRAVANGEQASSHVPWVRCEHKEMHRFSSYDEPSIPYPLVYTPRQQNLQK